MSKPIGARKAGTFLAVCQSPDPCKTPPNNAPVPYYIVAKLDDCLSVSPNVKYGGKPVVLADESSIAHVLGDEAGTGGGVKSGCNRGEVKFIEGDSTVRVNGKRVVREGDEVTMNGGNTKGTVICMPAPACGVDPQGRPEKDSDPPIKAPAGWKGAGGRNG